MSNQRFRLTTGWLIVLLVGLTNDQRWRSAGSSVTAGEEKPKTIQGRDGAEMVLIPAGEFQMGYDRGEDSEKPPHTIYVDAFYMDKYEVTNELFQKFVEQTGYQTVLEQKGEAYIWEGGWKWVKGANWRHPEGPESNLEGRLKHPVVHITWQDAVAYAQHFGKRLPTEAEWERAARGPKGFLFAYGNKYDATKANVDTQGTKPVGSFPPNDFGVFDLTGNVWEWCQDWFAPDFYQTSPARNPTGPAEGKCHVCRGGSWISSPEDSRVTFRNHYEPTFGNYSIIGFRCVIPASEVGM